MYAIVMKVTSPPRTSRRTVEPRAVIPKYRSRAPLSALVVVATGASLAYVSEPAKPPPEEVSARPAADLPAPTELEPLASLKPPNARPTPEPLEADTVRIVAVGTALWFAGFLVLLPFRGRLAEHGNEIWLWTCLAGGLLGLLGLLLAVRARAAARARAAGARRR
jgi:hypothetical protein